MVAKEIEIRLSALEAEVAELRTKVENTENKDVPWWMKISGTFADDPIYDEAMRLGRKYRKAQRKTQTVKKKKR